jgi:hypothetical protein
MWHFMKKIGYLRIAKAAGAIPPLPHMSSWHGASLIK